MSEIWKPIENAPNYHVSNYGRVRRIAGYRCLSDRILKLRKDGYGYLLAHLCVNGRRFNGPVHQLVCAAFCGPRPSPSHQVAHKDGCRSNNAAANLRWVTAKENAKDRDRHGTTVRGERSCHAKLTDEQVAYILSSPLNGVQLGRKLGVSSTQIYRIRKGKSRVSVEELTNEARSAA